MLRVVRRGPRLLLLRDWVPVVQGAFVRAEVPVVSVSVEGVAVAVAVLRLVGTGLIPEDEGCLGAVELDRSP